MKNQIKLLAFIALALLSVKSYSQSGNSITITPAITAQSNAFKNLAGSDRVAEFKVLKALVVTKSSAMSCAGVAVADFTTKTEFINLFGNPNSTLSPNLIAYNLRASSGACQAQIGVDDNGLILFITINKCP